MKKRILAMLVLVAMIVTACCTAFAATSNLQGGTKAGGGSNYFYFKSGNSTTSKIKFTCGKGKLDILGSNMSAYSVYGSYEVKITDKNTGKVVLDQDIYCRSSSTLSVKVEKNKEYKVQVYSWNPSTIATSYVKNKKVSLGITGASANMYGSASWVTLPTITASGASNCTIK